MHTTSHDSSEDGRVRPVSGAIQKETFVEQEMGRSAPVQTSQKDWNPYERLSRAKTWSPKTERSLSLCGDSRALASQATTLIRAIRCEFGAVAPLKADLEKSSQIQEIKDILKREIATENRIYALLDKLHAVGSTLEGRVFRAGLHDFQSSTGFLDDHPRICASICAGLGIATLAAGIYGAIITHGAVHHVVETVVGSVFGHGAIGLVASWVAVPVSLFFIGIPVLGSSVIGPLAFGALKTIGGKVTRAISSDHRIRFDEERNNAADLLTSVQDASVSILEGIESIKPDLMRFLTRNERLRAASSEALSAATPELQAKETVREVRSLNENLGEREFASCVQLLRLERMLRNLREGDFRSPELRGQDAHESIRATSSIAGRIGRALVLSFNALRSAASTSSKLGTDTALHTADDLHHACDHMPTGIADPISATGASLGTTLHIALETGARPEKALLDAVKGLVGLTKSAVAGGVPEGPSARALARVLFEVEEIERGNRVRWAFKLVPSLVFALLKKPALVLKAQKLEEASGKVSPQMLESEYAASKGRVYNAWKSTREIGRLLTGLVREGGYRWGVELPLSYLRAKGAPLNYLEKFGWARPMVHSIAQSSGAFLERSEDAHRRTLRRQMSACLAHIPNGKELDSCDSERLTLHAIRTYLDYRYNPESEVTEQELAATINYWRLRETSAWYRQSQRVAQYRAELKGLDARLVTLHHLLHGPEGLQALAASTYSFASLVGRKLRDPNSSDASDSDSLQRELNDFIDRWNETPLRRSLGKDLIVDSGEDGEPVAILLADGTLKLFSGAEGRAEILSRFNYGALLTTLPHADHARVAAAELVLAVPLENFQREALLEAQRRLVEEGATEDAVTPSLVACSFTPAQIVGATQKGAPLKRPGLCQLGIIGS